MRTRYHALTLRQPWAWAVFHAGKTIENRTFPTAHRGLLLIHAGRSRAGLEVEGTLAPAPEELVFGALLGTVQLVDCLPYWQCRAKPWARGPWCWLLAGARLFERPVPCRGQQGLWTCERDRLCD
jgi:hypothetical protein